VISKERQKYFLFPKQQQICSTASAFNHIGGCLFSLGLLFYNRLPPITRSSLSSFFSLSLFLLLSLIFPGCFSPAPISSSTEGISRSQSLPRGRFYSRTASGLSSRDDVFPVEYTYIGKFTISHGAVDCFFSFNLFFLLFLLYSPGLTGTQR
jgi:hypothetical protein